MSKAVIEVNGGYSIKEYDENGSSVGVGDVVYATREEAEANIVEKPSVAKRVAKKTAKKKVTKKK